MPNIEITATANVNQGVDGLKKVQQELGNTAIAAQKVDSTLGKTGTAIIGVGGAAKSAIPKVSELGTSFIKSHAQTLIFGAAMAGIGVAVAAASYWLKIVAKDFINTGNAAEDVGKKIKEYNDLVKSVTESVAKETTQVIGLLAVLKSETETRDRKLAAIKELQKIQPEIFNGLRLEKDAVIGLDEAYVSYISNLKNVIAAKILQAQIEKKVTELLTIQGAANTKEQAAQLESLKKSIAASKTLSEIKKNLQDTKLAGGFLTDKQSAERVAKLNEEIQSLFEKLSEFTKSIKVKEIKVKPKKVTIDTEEIDKLPFRTLSLLDDKTPTLKREPLVLVKPKIKFIDQEKNRQAVLDGIAELLRIERIERLAEEFSLKVSDVISSAMEQTGAGIADAIGSALAGGKDVIPNLFGNLMQSVGSQVQDLGKFLIKSAITIKIAKEAFNKLLANPVAAVAVGLGLVALGALLKQAAAKQYPGFATGVRNFDGGTAIVGERGPELVSLPRGSSVTPNGQLNAMGGREVFIAENVIRGTDLVTVYKKASAYNSRNGY